MKLPSRYEIVDKVNKWGEDIRNPTAVRQLDQEANLENESVLTLRDERGKRDIAIKQIERRFEQSKRIKVGMDKGPDFPGIYATEVLDFIPFFHLAANKTQLVVCDDNIDNELPNKKRTPNDFMLRQFTDHQDLDHKKLALYKYNHSEQLTPDIQQSVLFSKKQAAETGGVMPELNRAVQLEHVRDYVYKMDKSEYKNDYVLALGGGSVSA